MCNLSEMSNFVFVIIWDVHSLTTCSWDHFESKSSNKRESDLQQFVKKVLCTHYELVV